MEGTGELEVSANLPEDDSIFNLSNREDDPAALDSDALLEDSFSGDLQRNASSDLSTSTPIRPSNRGRGRGRGRGGALAVANVGAGRGGGGRFKCPKCPSSLASKTNLEAHLKRHVMKGTISSVCIKIECLMCCLCANCLPLF